MLFCVSILPYLPLLAGVYLFDDIQLIENNYTLKAVRSLSDVFTFVLKPSKPVSNFFLALGQWWGHGMVIHQRIVSLLLHFAVVALLYANLVTMRRHGRMALPRQFPFWVAVLFAVTPIHTESIGIGWFRMDMLGALFTLSGMWAVQTLPRTRHRLACFAALFLSLGLATFSKETFAVVTPAAILLTGWFTRSLHWRGALAVVVVQAFWAGILVFLLTLDARSDFPYEDVIGWRILEVPLHLRLAASALVEGIYKTLSGHGLTIVRLQERFGVGIGLGVEGAAAFLALFAGLCGWMLYRGGFLGLWGGLLFVSAGIYLVIPNLNIGSEHYWYLPATALFSLLLFGVWNVVKLYSPRPRRVLTLVVAVYAVALGMGLVSRSVRMISREKFYHVEWKKHPEAVGTWSDMTVVLMEKGKLEEARRFFEEAKRRDPGHPNVRINEFLLAFHEKDLKGARAAFQRIQEEFKSRPHLLGLFHFHLGILEEKQESSAAAALSYLKAMEQDPKVKFYREVYERTSALAKSAEP